MLKGINSRNILATVAVLPGIMLRERPRHNSILGHAHIVRFIRNNYFWCGTQKSLPVLVWLSETWQL